ncbi:MAG: ABC transporter permease [Alphaproteobacteria bacterium]
MTWFDLFISVSDSTLRLSAPLVMVALAGLISERSGVVDIGLEGKLLGGAFAAACIAYYTGNAWFGLLAAICLSIILSMLHGLASITFRGDQIISAVAINMMVSGLTVVVAHALFSKGGFTPALSGDARFQPITLPGAEAVADVPILGPIYEGLISGHNLLVYVCFAAVPLIWWVLERTRFGLRLRAVGENPAAVDTAGINVFWMRYRALIITGALCGVAGAYLSIANGSSFGREMSAGKGYIALAAMIFGKWRPVQAMLACLLFGFLEAMATVMQGVSLPLIGEIPIPFIIALPYVLTVILLAGFIGQAIAPKAIGKPYVKER